MSFPESSNHIKKKVISKGEGEIKAEERHIIECIEDYYIY
jgi:hypothetical protein